MRLLGERELEMAKGGQGLDAYTENVPVGFGEDARIASGAGGELVCYPEPNMSTPDGPVHSP